MLIYVLYYRMLGKNQFDSFLVRKGANFQLMILQLQRNTKYCITTYRFFTTEIFGLVK